MSADVEDVVRAAQSAGTLVEVEVERLSRLRSLARRLVAVRSLRTWHPSPCEGPARLWYYWESSFVPGGTSGSCLYDHLAYARWIGTADGHFYARVTGILLESYRAAGYECSYIGGVEGNSYIREAMFGDPGNWYDVQHFRGGVLFRRYHPSLGPAWWAPWPGGPHPY